MERQKIIMQPGPGDEISACKSAAVQECSSEQIDVEFTHNGRRFLVRWPALIAQCVEQE